jgi:K+ transporter
MMSAFVMLLKTIGVNLVKMLIGPKMILWMLRMAAKQSDNIVDDNIVLLVEGAYENDNVKVKSAVSALMCSFRKEKKKDGGAD